MYAILGDCKCINGAQNFIFLITSVYYIILVDNTDFMLSNDSLFFLIFVFV